MSQSTIGGVVGIVQDLLKLGVRVVLIVVREEVGVGEELGAGGEELAVVRVDVADGQAPWAIGGLDVLQVGEGLVGGVGVVVELGITVEVAVGALEVVPGGIGGAVPVESVRSGVAGAVGDGDVPLADVRGGVAGCLKQLAVGRICRIEDRHVGTGGYSGHEPALMCVETGDDGAASRCAGAGRSVVVREFYAALPDVFVEVRHEAPEVFFGAVDADGKDGGPTQLVDEDEEDVRFRSRFGDVFSETKASLRHWRLQRRRWFSGSLCASYVFSPMDEMRCCWKGDPKEAREARSVVARVDTCATGEFYAGREKGVN